MCTLGAIRPFKDGGSFLDDGKPFPSKMVKLLASKLSIKVVKDFPNRSSSKTHQTFGSNCWNSKKRCLVFLVCFPETPIGSMHFSKDPG